MPNLTIEIRIASASDAQTLLAVRRDAIMALAKDYGLGMCPESRGNRRVA